MSNLLSDKPIDPADRLIVALDVADAEAAKALVRQLGEAVRFYKIGLELFMAGGYFELLDWLVKQGKKVFVDLKFFDVPETVRSAVRALSSSGATLATVHGNQAIMEAAAGAANGVGIHPPELRGGSGPLGAVILVGPEVHAAPGRPWGTECLKI